MEEMSEEDRKRWESYQEEKRKARSAAMSTNSRYVKAPKREPRKGKTGYPTWTWHLSSEEWDAYINRVNKHEKEKKERKKKNG